MIENCNKIFNATEKCDVCQEKTAEYYHSIWYLHICSMSCLEDFLVGYNKEIDAIALDMKTFEELGEDKDEM